MKRSILGLTLLLILIGWQESTAKNGELKTKTSLSLSQEEEQELLQEYLPEVTSFEMSNFVTVQVFGPDGTLIIEGIITPGEEVDNQELRTLLNESEFLMNVGGTSLYRMEK